MKRICLLLCLSLAAAPVMAVTEQAKPGDRAIAAFGNLPLYFEANHGQADTSVQFLSRGRGYSFFLSPTEAVMALTQPKPAKENPSPMRAHRSRPLAATTRVIHMRFDGANPQARMTGAEELPGKINYLLGSDEALWRRNIATFARVRYEQ